MGILRRHLVHHGRFYVAALIGVVLYLLLPLEREALRVVAAGDAFFATYLVAMGFALLPLTTARLRKRADLEDEGIFLVVLMTLAAIVISGVAIVEVLSQKSGPSAIALSLSLAGAPLGWFALHTIAAAHYANLFYAPRGNSAENKAAVHGLNFPECKEPGIWEFIYFAFVVGSTAQTSDVSVVETKMRRAVLGHSVISFFYNTAIIAMAVNAVVSVAG